MVILKKLLPFFLLSVVACIFFYKYIIFDLVPFPGDLLLAEYQPFRSYSYEGYVAGSVPHKAQYFDSLREFYPWRTFTTNELKKGNLPLWNPHNFSGTPHLANFQTAVFYPLNLLYLLMNQVDAWSLLVFAQPLLASFFMYLYTRKIGINSFGSVVASIAFSYCMYMNVWLQFQVVGHTILWLPLILYGIEHMIVKYSPKHIVLLATSITFALFAGHPLDFGVIFLFSVLYLLFKVRKDLKHSLHYFLPFGAAILLGLIQLIPTINLLAHSTRAPFSYEFLVNNILIQPRQFITLMVPDFFGNPATHNYWVPNSYVGNTLYTGVITILFALFAVLWQKKYRKNGLIQFFSWSLLIVFLLATKNPISLIIYKTELPILSTIQPTKLLSIFAFSSAVLAGFGITIYSSHKDTLLKQHLPYVLSTVIALMFITMQVFFVSPEHRTIALKQSAVTVFISILTVTLVTITMHRNKFKKPALVILTAFLIFELFYSFQKFNPFVQRTFIFPEAPVLEYLQKKAGINRFWGYGTAKIDSNIATQYGLYSADGFDALNLKSYNQLVRSSKHGQLMETFTHETRSVAEIEPGYGETDLPNNQYRLKVLDMLGVKYVLNRIENPISPQTFPQDRFKLIWQDDAGWQMYENLKSAPRYFLTNKVIRYEDPHEFEQKFFDSTFDPSSMVLIDTSYATSPLCDDEEIRNSNVVLETYEPNIVIFKTQSSCPAFLFLSDTYERGWSVSINEKLSTLYKTNYAFRGVVVPPGSNTVVFNYQIFE